MGWAGVFNDCQFCTFAIMMLPNIKFSDIILLTRRYEKLQRWDDALKAYTAKATQSSNPHLVLDATLGMC